MGFGLTRAFGGFAIVWLESDRDSVCTTSCAVEFVETRLWWDVGRITDRGNCRGKAALSKDAYLLLVLWDNPALLSHLHVIFECVSAHPEARMYCMRHPFIRDLMDAAYKKSLSTLPHTNAGLLHIAQNPSHSIHRSSFALTYDHRPLFLHSRPRISLSSVVPLPIVTFSVPSWRLCDEP